MSPLLLSLLSLLTLLPTDSLPRAQVGPLQAWMARGAAGTCQLHLRNVGAVPVDAWTVTVRSDTARYLTIVREDHWRDAYHLPLAAARIEPGETDAFTIQEDGALGALTIRIALVVQSDGTAYGTSEPVPGVGGAEEERQHLTARRRAGAVEAGRHAERLESAIAADGVVRVLAARLPSTLLEEEGEWNWWRVRALVLAAESLPPGDRSATSRLREAVALLRDAQRKGSTDPELRPANPLSPVAVGTCG